MLEETPQKGEPADETAKPSDSPEAPDEKEVKLYDGPIEKFKGKPLEEFEKSYKSIESEYDKTLSEVKEVKEKLKAYEQYYQQVQMQQQAQQQHQPAPRAESTPLDFYDSPEASFDKLYQERRAKELYAEEAKSTFDNLPMYEFIATQKFPQVFEGKDLSEVRTMMANGLRSGQFNPKMARDPEMWAQSQRAIDWRNSGYKEQTNPKPSVPIPGEVPSAPSATAPTPQATVDPDFQAFALHMVDGDPKRAQQLLDETLKEIEESQG